MSFATPFSIVGTTSVGSEIRIPEATTNGANYVGFKAPDSLSADKVWTLPSADGTSGQVLQTNGSGVLSFASVSSSAKMFSVYRSGNQSVSNNTATKIQFNAEEYDASNWFDSTTNYRLTPTTAGYYYLTATLFTNANGGANPTTSIIYLYKNGSQYKWFISQQSGSSGQFSAIISTVVYANGSSDYFECYGQTSNAGVPVFQGGSDTTHFSGFYIGS